MKTSNKLGLWIIALMTGLVGVVNLVSAVTPSLPRRVALLQETFPFEIRAGSHIFGAVTGFILLTLASRLLRRKRAAWVLTIVLLLLSIISNLLKGLDVEESLLSFALLILLVVMRDNFTAQSDRPSMAQGVGVLAGALIFTLAYGVAGFFLMDRQYSVEFDLFTALTQTLAIFFTADNAGLEPTTRFGRFFIDSIYIVGASTLTYAVLMLLRPVLLRTNATEDERRQAQTLVEQYGHSSLARFCLLPDKSYYFSPTGKTTIAYVAKGKSAIALGDPIGAKEDLETAIAGYQEFCDRNDWHPAFYQTLPENLTLYRRHGFQTLKIGEEAVIDLKTFTTQGKAGKSLRPSVNKFQKLGYQVKFYELPIADELLAELKIISDEWLEEMEGAEKQFSLGWFDYDYLRGCEIAVVESEQGKAVAFANVVPEYQVNEITIDLMRRCSDAEKGVMDFLFISMFQHFKSSGYDSFNLGLSALSGVGATKDSPRLERGLNYLYEHLNRFYNFKGLHGFKEKFNPRWESRYLIYPSLAALPDVVVSLVRADSGDRLLDYFKPGS